MGLWSDLAEYVGPTPNHGGHMLEQRGMVLHIMAGTYDGSIAWGKNPQSQVSFHFAVRRSDGHIGQLLDTDVTAWTQRDGNGHWVSAENEGYLPQALTDAQVEANAKLYARGHQVYGWPLQIANSPTERGLGHHSMGAENGYDWGHSSCPGEAVKAQKPAILARAIAIVNGHKEDDMPEYVIEVRDNGEERVIAVTGTHWYWVRDASKCLPVFGKPFPTTKITTAQLLGGFGVDVERTLATPLTPDELAAIEQAAREGAQAGAGGLSYEETVKAAQEGANLAEDS